MTKRLFDIVVASLGLVMTAPLMVLLALGVLATMGAPVTFRQERVGRGGRGFELFKFRSMREVAMYRRPLPDAERTAPLGRFLRAAADELPGAWPVLCGDMSVVGPRPLPRPILEEHGVRRAVARTARPDRAGAGQRQHQAQRPREIRDRLIISTIAAWRRPAIIWKNNRVVLTGERAKWPDRKAMAYANHPDRSG